MQQDHQRFQHPAKAGEVAMSAIFPVLGWTAVFLAELAGGQS